MRNRRKSEEEWGKEAALTYRMVSTISTASSQVSCSGERERERERESEMVTQLNINERERKRGEGKGGRGRELTE